MDIPRQSQARARRRRRIIGVIGSLGVLAAITAGLSRLKPAAPTVERSANLTDTVKRGSMVVNVHGAGALVPEEIRWIAAENAGRVERILIWPGTAVKAETVLVELKNPELEQGAFEALWQLKAAEAELTNLKVQLESQRLTQQAAAATALANYNRAKLEAEVNDELAKDGLVPAITQKQSKANAEEFLKLSQIEEERSKITAGAIVSQVAVQEAKVEQLRAQLSLRNRQVESLKVRAGMDGVLQRLGEQETLQVGQQLGVGANLARVANPARLKAEIKIPETQAKDVQLGQRATIDTRNGIINGTVVRIDPGSQNGTRTVDVKLEGELPRGAVPELSVDGTIEIERLENVLHVGRPVHGQADQTISLFKLQDGGKRAVRVAVKLGRSSVNMIQVLDGLEVGDEVILSDMSQWDGHDRLRIN